MDRLTRNILLLLVTGFLGWQPQAAWSGESIGQERIAYYELSRVRAMSKPGVTFEEYRKALEPARLYVGLLRNSSSTTVPLLRKAMSYYEQALSVWSQQADSQFPVDSLRTDEPNGAAILRQCPEVPRFHYRDRDQIYVKDAVECIWRQAAELLDKAPAELR